MNKTAIFASLAALIVGMGVGATGEPEVITKTVTGPTVEVIKEVSVPVEAKTVEITTNVIPDGCTDAIAAARKVAGITSGFVDAVGKYPPLVAQAYEAGATNNSAQADRVISTMGEIKDEIDSATGKMAPTVASFNTAAADCK